MPFLVFYLLFILPFYSSAQSGKIEQQFFVKDSHQVLYHIIARHPELIIDHRSEKGFELYGPKGTDQYLDLLKADYHPLNDHILKSITESYPSYQQHTQTLKKLANQYPHILKLESIGQSVEGRELWVMKISDNVSLDEHEPEFKYISSMHGNEITGRDVMIKLIEHLATQYGQNQKITELINNTEIYIMPSMNPDGSERRSRANRNGYDLNRNFPQFTKMDDDKNRQPETHHLMNWQAQRQFALSANFHGGAEVVNYPWDSTYDRHPLDHLVQEFSLEYAGQVPYLKNSRFFANGITNGADWYLVRGGMQDWSYHWFNDLQITVEISGNQWPSYSQIQYYFQENLPALITYMERVHQGTGFIINSHNTLMSGMVEIFQNGLSLGKYPFRNSEFYKVLEVGHYQFQVTANDGNNGLVFNFQTEVTPDINPNGAYQYL